MTHRIATRATVTVFDDAPPTQLELRVTGGEYSWWEVTPREPTGVSARCYADAVRLAIEAWATWGFALVAE